MCSLFFLGISMRISLIIYCQTCTYNVNGSTMLSTNDTETAHSQAFNGFDNQFDDLKETLEKVIKMEANMVRNRENYLILLKIAKILENEIEPRFLKTVDIDWEKIIKDFAKSIGFLKVAEKTTMNITVSPETAIELYTKNPDQQKDSKIVELFQLSAAALIMFLAAISLCQYRARYEDDLDEREFITERV